MSEGEIVIVCVGTIRCDGFGAVVLLRSPPRSVSNGVLVGVIYAVRPGRSGIW